jgi:hypothetical protein
MIFISRIFRSRLLNAGLVNFFFACAQHFDFCSIFVSLILVPGALMYAVDKTQREWDLSNGKQRPESGYMFESTRIASPATSETKQE